MRTFVLGSGQDRKFVHIEIQGRRMAVIQGKADGSTKRSEKELTSEAEAASASQIMARELLSRGFVEQNSSGKKAVKSEGNPGKSPKAKPVAAEPDEPEGGLYALDEEEAEEAAPLLPRMATAQVATTANGEQNSKKSGVKKKKKKKKQRSAGGSENELDKRVVGGVIAAVVAMAAFGGYIAYQAFLKPPTIVGSWQGSRVEYETGGPMSFLQMGLVLDGQSRASMSVQGSEPSVGSYRVEGKKLKLAFKDEDGETSEVTFRYDLGRATLDLYETETEEGKKIVQLIRLRDEPVVAGGGGGPGAPQVAAVAAPDAAPGDKAADAALVPVEFVSKDGAFKLRHPEGWESKSGSRPDNTYSWAEFTKGSARIRVDADIKGSLMAGPNVFGSDEEGAEHPVAAAHELNQKTVAEQYTDFKESEPVPFQGDKMGEGRLATFTAKGGGLVFAPDLQGYRATFLTNDRRITILCHCPETEFEKLKPAFLAVCRLVSR